MNNQPLFSAQDIAYHISFSLGKNVSTSFVYTLMREIDPPEGDRYSKNKKFTSEQRDAVSFYCREWHGKMNPPGMVDFLESKNMHIPLPFSPPVVVENKYETKKNESKIDYRKIESIVEKRVKAVIEKKLSTLNYTALPDNIKESKARALAIEPIHKRINSFVFSEPVSIDFVWNRLRELFQLRNETPVRLHGNQSFPQWLHSEGLLELFTNQLQGFLDQIHDEVHGQKVLGL